MTEAETRAAFRRRLARYCMEQPVVQIPHTCPTCGCRDVEIRNHLMTCQRRGHITDLSVERAK